MTAREFFEHQLSTDANSVIDRFAYNFSRNDLIKFAEAYRKACACPHNNIGQHDYDDEV